MPHPLHADVVVDQAVVERFHVVGTDAGTVAEQQAIPCRRGETDEREPGELT